jgi:hypothetical protein
VGCGIGALSNVVSSCEQRVIDGRTDERTDGRTDCVHTAEKCWSDACDAEKRTCGLGSRLVCSAVRRHSQTTNERRLAKWSVLVELVVTLWMSPCVLDEMSGESYRSMFCYVRFASLGAAGKVSGRTSETLKRSQRVARPTMQNRLETQTTFLYIY